MIIKIAALIAWRQDIVNDRELFLLTTLIHLLVVTENVGQVENTLVTISRYTLHISL